MPLDLDKYNDAIADWDQQSNADVKKRASGYNIIHRSDSPSRGSSINKFRSRTFKQDGAIVRISKVFPRSLIYPHKGAGKGMGGTKGSRWVDKYGKQKSTNPASLGKMGTGNRQEKPFINDSLDGPHGVEELATVAAEHLGDALVGSLFIK